MKDNTPPEVHLSAESEQPPDTDAGVCYPPRCGPDQCRMGWMHACKVNGCALLRAREVLDEYRQRREQREQQGDTGK